MRRRVSVGWTFATAALAAILWTAAPRPASAQDACTDCHETDVEAFAGTVHGFAECVDCHSGAGDFPHDEASLQPDCAVCHEDVTERYAASVHGTLRISGVAEAPDCAACHAEVHRMVPRSDPDSPIHPLRLPETCGACHADPQMVAKFGIPLALPLAAYRASVHARMVAEGASGPTCGDCHGSHSIQPASDPQSKVFHRTVPETCGGCHSEIAAQYRSSVHGRAAAHGAREAPVCTDCHGEHRILSPRERGSQVFASNIPKMTCGRCHNDLRLNEKYGMQAGKVPAYEDSYHGLAARSGRLTVAHCASCHGVHDILPSTDPLSHTNPTNLSVTCGQCHPGAGTRFAIGQVHVVSANPDQAAVYWVRLLYIWLIYLSVGGMVLHNLLDLARKMRAPPSREPFPRRPAEPRMPAGFRSAHVALIVSFAMLVYTGFALTYPEAWWARPLLRWEATIGLRGWLHRAAAVVMLLTLAFHLVHLAVDRRARACIAGMRPTRGDLREFAGRMAYYVGRRADPPPAEKLGYPEKVEYLALMWGLAVMSLTGLVLWFDNVMLRWLPKWFIDVATVIHFYEAVLATLAILVWHFYFVIFDPVVYPMDTAWLTGRSAPGRERERAAPHQASRDIRPDDAGRADGARGSGDATRRVGDAGR